MPGPVYLELMNIIFWLGWFTLYFLIFNLFSDPFDSVPRPASLLYFSMLPRFVLTIFFGLKFSITNVIIFLFQRGSMRLEHAFARHSLLEQQTLQLQLWKYGEKLV